MCVTNVYIMGIHESVLGNFTSSMYIFTTVALDNSYPPLSHMGNAV